MNSSSPNVEVTFETLRSFVLSLGNRLGASPTHEQLSKVARELRDLAVRVRWDPARFPMAPPGELLMRDVVISPDDGPSLYLVSESPGTIDPPHEHGTWAVIVGIHGQEKNHIYEVVDEGRRHGAEVSSNVVGPGEVLVLANDVVHRVSVIGGGSTFHLHMYGSPISVRPPFASRCFREADPAQPW